MIELTSDVETIYFFQVKKKTVVEARLTKEERQQFDRAKDACLYPWIENYAWEAADQEEVAEGEDCPLRFLLTWKLEDGHFVAKARLIMQGFKHKDVVTGEVNKESPTLSRLGRFVTFLILAMNNWKFFTADVKSAFLASR